MENQPRSYYVLASVNESNIVNLYIYITVEDEILQSVQEEDILIKRGIMY